MAWSTPPTFVAGTTLTAGDLNTLSGDLAMLAGARTAYAPTWSNLTTTSATVTSVYRQIDKEVEFFIQVTFGASTAITAAVQVSLPVTAKYAHWLCDGSAIDSSASATVPWPVIGDAINTTTLAFRVPPPTLGTQVSNVNTTSPFTWATGDILTISGRYEAA